MMIINPMSFTLLLLLLNNEDDCQLSPGAGPCPACLRHSDVLRDHLLCCESGGERISRHNALRDALFDTAVAAGLGATKEGGKVPLALLSSPPFFLLST